MGLESGNTNSNELTERRLTELVMENSQIFASIVPSTIILDSEEATSHDISEIDCTHCSWSDSTAAVSRSTQTAGVTLKNSNATLIEFSETETEKVQKYSPGFEIRNTPELRSSKRARSHEK